ncbi:MAG: AAA family ATPase [Clostridia bacterium]|nr:AAA family ATPase [Clostridia bacterium]
MMIQMESTVAMQMLKEGMSDNEWKRFRELSQLKLSDDQLSTLVKRAQDEPIQNHDEVSRVTFNSMEEIEAAYLVMKNRVPEWLRPHLDTSFHSMKESKDSATRDSEFRALQYMLGIKWSHERFRFDKNKFVKAMKAELYGMDQIIEQIADNIAVISCSNDEQHIRTICLEGPCGVGKTTLSKAVARHLNIPYQEMYMGGACDPEDIIGSSKIYANGQPGKVIRKTYASGSSRQLLFWDELDKVVNKHNQGHITDTILSFFSEGYMPDNYWMINADLRSTINIAAVNNSAVLPTALRDRMLIIRMSDYTPEQKKRIVKDYIWPRMQRALLVKTPPLSDAAVSTIVDGFSDCGGMRDIEKALEKIRNHCIGALEDWKPLKCIDKEQVLQCVRFPYRKIVSTVPRIGTATALAVSDLVGTTLEVQVEIEQGAERMIVTGLPQEDMLDSCKLALHLAAKHTGKSDACTVRIHLDEGAVKKSGPSAGIMIYLALWSAFSEIPLTNEMCGSGEIDLLGNVKPVGAIGAKLIAAERANAKIAFIPAACIHEVPELSSLTVVPIENVEDMTRYILEHYHTTEHLSCLHS